MTAIKADRSSLLPRASHVPKVANLSPEEKNTFCAAVLEKQPGSIIGHDGFHHVSPNGGWERANNKEWIARDFLHDEAANAHLLDKLIEFDRTRRPGQAWIMPQVFEWLGNRANEPLDRKTVIVDTFILANAMNAEANAVFSAGIASKSKTSKTDMTGKGKQ